MGEIDLAVKKILDRDLEFQFKIIATEIDRCRTRADMERMVDEYVSVLREEIKRRILEKNPRLK